MKYKHTQIGYLMIFVMLVVMAFFVWLYTVAALEPESVDSGSNFVITAVMVLVLGILGSFVSLSVMIDEKYLQVKFGFGIFQKKFLLQDIQSVKSVRNHWYYGWGIKWWWNPKMWIYSVSGLDAVEIVLNNGKIYRIGTDEPKELEYALSMSVNSNIP
ncbi:hypothetical protein H6758_00925 [Candidatus Nomurabacteria bacterium]|nr:hypothetical protein [Candidatus Nomurabacteria bacterium]